MYTALYLHARTRVCLCLLYKKGTEKGQEKSQKYNIQKHQTKEEDKHFETSFMKEFKSQNGANTDAGKEFQISPKKEIDDWKYKLTLTLKGGKEQK